MEKSIPAETNPHQTFSVPANLLFRISRAMAIAETPEALLRAFTAPLQEDEPCDAYLFYTDKGDDADDPIFRLVASAVTTDAQPPVEFERPAFSFEAGRQIGVDSGNLLEFSDLEADNDLIDAPLREAVESVGGRAMTIVPLLPPNRGGVGSVALVWPTPHTLTDQQRELYTILAPQMAALVDNQRLLRVTQQQANYRDSLLKALPVGLVTVGSDGQILQVNLVFAKMLGYEVGALGGRQEKTLIPAEQWTAEQKLREAVQGGGPVVRFESKRLHKDGSHIPVLVSVSRVESKTEQATKMLVAVQDLSLQKRVQKALNESRQMLQTVMDAIPHGIFWKDLDSVYLGCNKAFAADAGLAEPADVIGLTDYDLPWEKAEADAFRRSDVKIISGGKPLLGVIESQRQADGQHAWVRTSKVPLADESGEVVGILGTYQDVTDIRAAEAALRQSEERFRHVFEESPLGMVIVDHEGVITRVNPTLLTMLSFDDEKLAGRRLQDLIHPADRKDVQRCRDSLYEGRVDSYRTECRYLRKGRDVIWVEMTATLLRESGEAPLMLTMVQDITERKWIEDAEREQRTLAEALRDTIAAVSGTLELDEVLDRILENVEHVVPQAAANVMLIEDGVAHIVRARGYAERGLTSWIEEQRFVIDNVPLLHQMATAREPICVVETRGNPHWTAFKQTDWIRSHIGAPIIVKKDVIGFLHADHSDPAVFSPADAERLQAFADQAAIALSNAKLFSEGRRQLQRAQTLQEVGALLTSRMSLKDVLERILSLLAQVVSYDSASLQLFDSQGNLELIVGQGFPDEDMAHKVAADVTRETIDKRWAKQDVLVIKDTQSDERWVTNEAQAYIRSWVGAALRVRGQLIGLLNVDSATPGAYDEETARTILSFANQAAIAIENARLYGESQRRNTQLEVLNRITRVGTAALSPDELLKALTESITGVIDADMCYISMLDPESGAPVMAAVSGFEDAERRLPTAEAGENSLTQAVLRARSPLIIESLETTPYLSDRLRNSLAPDVLKEGVLVLPLEAGERQLGALVFGFKEQHRFSPEEVAWASQAAELAALALIKAQLFADLEARVERRTAELRAANERLRELGQIKDEFVSNVSHELRTPIASIKLYHHLLTARPEKQVEYLGRLDRETERLERIIEDLLYLSRMDQDELCLKPRPVDLNSLVDLYLIDRQVLASERGLDLNFVSDPGLPIVFGDELSLGRALDVLLTNALSYSGEGASVTVRTSALTGNADQPGAALSVANTGPPISSKERPHLFERFFRGQSARDSGTPGTGLGLAIAREIVERHKGTIKLVDGGEDGETCFTIWLPAAGTHVED